MWDTFIFQTQFAMIIPFFFDVRSKSVKNGAHLSFDVCINGLPLPLLSGLLYRRLARNGRC